MNQSAPPSRELTHIGHYAILDSIGRGGMGLVYLARDTRLDRLVAIKCLRTELFEPLYRERFKREALLLAKLNHPYIVQIYDFIETPEQLGLVMEFVDGQNLQRYLREQIVPFSQRMQWLTQIAKGLAVAHDAGIIHRDLKAENILINKRGDAKISDLGIAKSLDSNLTLTEHVTGSYASMSPEQALGNTLDFRSDLFSFGILAYQLLCGAHPFGDTDNKMQLLQRIISQPPTSPSKHNPDLPPEISDLLGQLLSKDPSKRPANTHWLAAQCEKLSQLLLTNSLEPDNTPVLLHSEESLKSYTTGNHTGGSLSGIRKHYTGSTREHATFDTRFEIVPVTQKIHSFIQRYTIQMGAACAMLLVIAGITYWQMQPKQPDYIAVLPPNLNVEGMQESQQELIKAAVYDAAQQSILQLDNYYLIPHSEVEEIKASHTKEGIEMIRRAIAADEIITTEIQCKREMCRINISRLTSNGHKDSDRLKVKETKAFDVLTDNYLTVATIVQTNIGSLYSEKFINRFQSIDEQEYSKLLSISQTYNSNGASIKLLDDLDKLSSSTQSLFAAQSLYTEISLDLHYETKDSIYLTKLNKNMEFALKQKDNKEALYNKYYLQIAEKDFDGATETTAQINQTNASSSLINELLAYTMMAKKDYSAAIKLYKKSLETKKTAKNLYYISQAYWHAADTTSAKKYLQQSLDLSPNLYKALTLYGIVELLDGNIGQAIILFEKIAQEKPDDVYNISHLGLCHTLLKNYTKASQLFDQAIKLAPQNTYFKLNKADSENLQGNIAESNKLYTEIITSTKPENISNEELSSIAQAYAHLGRFQEALTTLQQLEKVSPQDIETIFSSALIHALAKNNASAILNIERSLEHGMSKIWFDFSWFDGLCQDAGFIQLMLKHGEPNRCTPQ